MSVILDATGDGFGYTGAPDGTYWAGCGWFYFPSFTHRGGLLSNGNAASSDWCALSVNSSGQLSYESEGGATAIVTSPVAGWYYGYIRNDGTNVAAGYATAGGTFSTSSTGAQNVVSAAYLGLGCYDPRGDGFTHNVYVGNCIVWSGAAAANIPSVEQLQIQRQSMRPLFLRSDVWVWQPCWSHTNTPDLSGNGRTVTTAGTLTSGDGPPVGWGAAPHLVGAAVAASGRNPVSMGFDLR